jgi:hypothetical protein
MKSGGGLLPRQDDKIIIIGSGAGDTYDIYSRLIADEKGIDSVTPGKTGDQKVAV